MSAWVIDGKPSSGMEALAQAAAQDPPGLNYIGPWTAEERAVFVARVAELRKLYGTEA